MPVEVFGTLCPSTQWPQASVLSYFWVLPTKRGESIVSSPFFLSVFAPRCHFSVVELLRLSGSYF